MHETKTKACNYIPIYLFQSSTVSSQYNYPLCQTYMLLLYCFHEMLPLLPLGFLQETYLFHLQVWLHLVFCSLNAQCFYACNTLCSYGYEVPVTKMKLHKCRFSNPTSMFHTTYTSQTDLFCMVLYFQITHFITCEDYFFISLCCRGEKS